MSGTQCYGIMDGTSTTNYATRVNSAQVNTGVAIQEGWQPYTLTFDSSANSFKWYVKGSLLDTNTGDAFKSSLYIYGGNNVKYSIEYYDNIECFADTNYNSTRNTIRTGGINFATSSSKVKCSLNTNKANAAGTDCFLSSDNTNWFNATNKLISLPSETSRLYSKINFTDSTAKIYDAIYDLVNDTSNPTITLEPDNFFVDGSIISANATNASKNVNITINDNYGVYMFSINLSSITTGVNYYLNVTNYTSTNATLANFKTQIVFPYNLPQDNYQVVLKAWDSSLNMETYSYLFDYDSIITFGCPSVGLDSSQGFYFHNISFYDEKSLRPQLATFTITYDYSVASGDLSKTYTSTLPNISVCVYPQSSTINLDYTIDYGYFPTYPLRTSTQTSQVLTNATTKTSLYLLNSSVGIYGRFGIVDSFQRPISSVVVTMTDSTGILVEVESSDDAGLVTFWLDPDETYTFVFSKEGYSSITSVLRITDGSILPVIMGVEQTTLEYEDSFKLNYFFKPIIEIYNYTSYPFSFNLTSSHWNITSCTFSIRNETDILSSVNAFVNSTYCFGNITYNTGRQNYLISYGEWVLNSTSTGHSQFVYLVEQWISKMGTLSQFFTDISNFSGGGFDSFSKSIIALIFIAMIVSAMSMITLTQYDMEKNIILLMILIDMLSYLGYFNMNISSMSASNQKYIIAILSNMIGLGFILQRNL